MKLSLPRPQNSVEALFSLSYMLLKLAFWQACMKWVHISARTAPLVLIRVALLVWRAPSAEDPAPPGWNSIQMPAIWQHQHCLILYSWLASINNMADSTRGISNLSFAHLDFWKFIENDLTAFPKSEKSDNKKQHGSRWLQKEREQWEIRLVL